MRRRTCHIARCQAPGGMSSAVRSPWSVAACHATENQQHSPPLAADLPSGMTLFEVVLALAIFLGSWAVLSQLFATGSRASTQARLQAEAVIHAQSKMAEIVAGVLPVDTMTNQPFDDPDLMTWTWSSTVAAGPHIDLLAVDVTVRREGSEREPPMQYTLRRYVRDPQLFLDAATQSAAAEANSQ